MRVIKKTGFLSLLVLLTLFVQSSFGAIVDLQYLPDSSYAELMGKWQGQRVYEEDNFRVLVEFVVYDQENLQNGEEIALAEALGLDGQYIYAYQLTNTAQEGYDDVARFKLLNLDGTDLGVTLDDIGMYDNGDGGESPDEASTEGYWEWTGENGYLSITEHSWFLIFSSEAAPVAGDYTLEAPEDVPVPVPEPATTALLVFGSAIFLLKRPGKTA